MTIRLTRHDRIVVMASAIANARGMRRGTPEIKNILDVLEETLPHLHEEVMEDAEAALVALETLEGVEDDR